MAWRQDSKQQLGRWVGEKRGIRSSGTGEGGHDEMEPPREVLGAWLVTWPKPEGGETHGS